LSVKTLVEILHTWQLAGKPCKYCTYYNIGNNWFIVQGCKKNESPVNWASVV